MRQRILRQRPDEYREFEIGADLSAFAIPEEFTKTCKGSNFLFHDSGMDDPLRIIIFATDENIKF